VKRCVRALVGRLHAAREECAKGLRKVAPGLRGDVARVGHKAHEIRSRLRESLAQRAMNAQHGELRYRVLADACEALRGALQCHPIECAHVAMRA
jgi:hypothetical protein